MSFCCYIAKLALNLEKKLSFIPGFSGLFGFKALENPEVLNEEGKRLFFSGNLVGALERFDAALIIKPDYFVVYSNRGAVLKELKRFSDALCSFDAALDIKPDDSNTHYNKALTLLQMKRPFDALISVDAALAVNPGFAEAYNSRGVVFRALEHLEEAVTCFDAALNIRPDYAEAYWNRGLMLLDLNRPEEALKDFDAALALKSDVGELHYGRGRALQQLDRLEEALVCYDQSLRSRPSCRETQAYRGVVLCALNRPEEALACFDAAISIEPDWADGYFIRGVVLQEINRSEEALESFATVLLFDPNSSAAYFNQGVILLGLKRLEEALKNFDAGLAIETNCAESYHNRGVVLNALMRKEDALANFDAALVINPNFAVAHNSRGVVLNDLERQQEALASYEKALSIAPEYAEAYNNLGVVGADLRGPEYALTNFDAALSIKPNYADAIVNKGMVLLQKGIYREGWRLYEWRWKRDAVKDQFGFKEPSWLGEENIAGKTILIYPEQGFGDYIQFCRYAPILKAMGAVVILETPKELVSIMATLEGKFQIVEKGGPLPPYDYQCPIMSLPLALGTEIETIPAAIPYLFADATGVQKWRNKIGVTKKIRIGLVWSGSLTHKKDYQRSIALSLFEPIFDLPAEYHCLQKDILSGDQAVLEKYQNIKWHSESLSDFGDTAGLIEVMDLIVSVDTSVAHLAGAMGKPVWILLPFSPDYRWMLERKDTPWYPNVVLFRQPNIGDWESVLLDLREKLEKIFALPM